jgi:hypothetical protein
MTREQLIAHIEKHGPDAARHVSAIRETVRLILELKARFGVAHRKDVRLFWRPVDPAR